MPKSTKSRDRITKNGKPNGASKNNPRDRKSETEVDLLTPEEWIGFGETHRLSGRELSIMALTSQGMTRKAIGKRLHVTVHAVNKYCDRLHKKLSAKGSVGMLCQLFRFMRGLAST